MSFVSLSELIWFCRSTRCRLGVACTVDENRPRVTSHRLAFVCFNIRLPLLRTPVPSFISPCLSFQLHKEHSNVLCDVCLRFRLALFRSLRFKLTFRLESLDALAPLVALVVGRHEQRELLLTLVADLEGEVRGGEDQLSFLQ